MIAIFALIIFFAIEVQFQDYINDINNNRVRNPLKRKKWLLLIILLHILKT